MCRPAELESGWLSKRLLLQGSDAEVSIQISLAEAYTGSDKLLKFKRRVVCKGCRTDNAQVQPVCVSSSA